jgi:hypothetical protein
MNNDKKIPRQRFLTWGAGIAAALAIPSFLRFSKRKPVPEKFKMLTQDGTLVEIDAAHLPQNKQKVTMAALQQWVHKKPSSL